VFFPAGRFFLRRILLDDFRCGEFYLRTKLSLDPPIQMAEVAETLRTAQRFAEALGYDGPKTSLYFQFWWSLLEGRILGSWTHPGVDFFVSSVATDNDRQSRIRMPMDASAEQLIAGVAEALLPENGSYCALKRRAAKKRSSPCTTSSKNSWTSTLKQPA
jgi:hypothetical protein